MKGFFTKYPGAEAYAIELWNRGCSFTDISDTLSREYQVSVSRGMVVGKIDRIRRDEPERITRLRPVKKGDATRVRSMKYSGGMAFSDHERDLIRQYTADGVPPVVIANRLKKPTAAVIAEAKAMVSPWKPLPIRGEE